MAELHEESRLLKGHCEVPRAAQPAKRHRLLEAQHELLRGGAAPLVELHDGLVRGEHDGRDRSIRLLAGECAAFEHDRGEMRRSKPLVGCDGRDSRAVDGVRLVQVNRVEADAKRDEEGGIGEVPQDLVASIRHRQLGDGQHRLVDGREQVAKARSVDEGDARARSVREARSDWRVVTELRDLRQLGQVHVRDGAAPRAVNQEFGRERQARDVALLLVVGKVARRDAVARIGPEQRFERDAPRGEDCHVVGVEVDGVDSAEVLLLVREWAACVAQVVEKHVVVHAERHVRRPECRKVGLHLHGDDERLGLRLGRVHHGDLEQRGQVHVSRAVCRGEHGQRGEEIVNAPGARGDCEDLPVARPLQVLQLPAVRLEHDALVRQLAVRGGVGAAERNDLDRVAGAHSGTAQPLRDGERRAIAREEFV